jgi:hypothetical protein
LNERWHDRKWAVWKSAATRVSTRKRRFDVISFG